MSIDKVKDSFEQQKKIADEINVLSEELRHSRDEDEDKIIISQIESLRNSLKESGRDLLEATESVYIPKPLNQVDDVPRPIEPPAPISKPAPITPPAKPVSPPVRQPVKITMPQEIPVSKGKYNKHDITELERLSLKRMKVKEGKVVAVKEKKPNMYVKFASKLFGERSLRAIKKGKYSMLRRDLIKANLEFVPANYISIIFLSTILSFFAAILIMIFFLFFSLIATPPFIVPVEENLTTRLAKVFWIIFFVPGIAYLFAYFYPAMERKSLEGKINQELPYSVVHMSSISNSMIEPSKIFSIIITTKEYPNLSREFTKLLNEVNIYGYDLVSALRDMAFNSPSRKLAELYNGLATTINSGGDLPDFFDERAKTLLFEHRLEVEKQAKAAETFMDIYISVVIAAPMILMLLLMMMRVSGLGLTLSTGMITLVMVLGVSLMNILFLAFLHIKQPTGGAQ